MFFIKYLCIAFIIIYCLYIYVVGDKLVKLKRHNDNPQAQHFISSYTVLQRCKQQSVLYILAACTITGSLFHIVRLSPIPVCS